MTAPMTRSNLKPAKLKNLNTDEIVNFMFNPFEFSISKSNTWAPKVVSGVNLPLLTFTSGGAKKLTLNLVFDATRPPSDVRAFTAPLWKMVMIDEEKADPTTGKGEPPPVSFIWGALEFKAVITSLTEKFKLFDPEGVPLRCEVTIALEQYADVADLPPQVQEQLRNEQIEATQPQQEGDRLDNVATQNGQPPGNHRQIAEQNNIDNPHRVPNGTPLRVTG